MLFLLIFAVNSPVNFTVALYKPLIPPNTGNIARLCVALNCPLYIIGKTPIRWDDAQLKRAGLDHWEKLQFKHYESWKKFYLNNPQRRIVAVSKESTHHYWDFSFLPDDVLLFGNETSGLPPALLRKMEHSVKIPMWGQGVRSLNLSNSVAVTAYEAYRQFAENKIIDKAGITFERTYFKKNAKL